LKEQTGVIAGTTWWLVQVCEVNAADARVCCKNQLAQVGTRKGKKGGKEMARPYTKLAPAAKTGHQDAIALARSRNGSKEGRTWSGRSRDEVWRVLGGPSQPRHKSIRGAANALTAENPLAFGTNSRHQLPDAQVLWSCRKSPTSSVDDR
jgi:hypothetical protein